MIELKKIKTEDDYWVVYFGDIEIGFIQVVSNNGRYIFVLNRFDKVDYDLFFIMKYKSLSTNKLREIYTKKLIGFYNESKKKELIGIVTDKLKEIEWFEKFKKENK